MTTHSENPWVTVLMNQLWWCRQTTEVIEKCVPAELVLDPKALAEYCLLPSERRLNPMEFHGKRQAQASDRDNAPRVFFRTERPQHAYSRPARRLRSSA
ncbi:MAG: hypothetical protein ABI343_00315 [Burkholderiaceae bacterium]